MLPDPNVIKTALNVLNNNVTDKENTKMATDTVTLSKDELGAIVAAATKAAVAAVKGGAKKKTSKKKTSTKKKAAVVQRRADQRDKNVAQKTAQAEGLGVSFEEVDTAWKDAHVYAKAFNAEGPAAYKAAFDEKLMELIGCTRWAE